ncbi:hypothetical protein FPE53_24125, partial [Salmonella enterica subsp. enterica]|nr:hypothetical protein [Salmonella enterica subsp. enterica serovar Aqua]
MRFIQSGLTTLYFPHGRKPERAYDELMVRFLLKYRYDTVCKAWGCAMTETRNLPVKIKQDSMHYNGNTDNAYTQHKTTCDTGIKSSSLKYISLTLPPLALALLFSSNMAYAAGVTCGEGAEAIRDSSTACGKDAKATVHYSVAIGTEATASGDYGTATGSKAQASGEYSTATGAEAKAIGDKSTATGVGAEATNNSSTATGVVAKATGNLSTATGARAQATGENSVALGAYSRSSNANEVNIGIWEYDDYYGINQRGTRTLSGLSAG